MFTGMRRQRTREGRKLRWTPTEGTDTGSNHQSVCEDSGTFLEDKPEAFDIRFDASNLALIEVGHGLTLIPEPVGNEAVERHRTGKVLAGCGLEGLQSQRLVR